MSEVNHPQAGYEGSPARAAGHEHFKFQMYYGWKECQRLGIEYVREPLSHSNIYHRKVSLSGNVLNHWYVLGAGLTSTVEATAKYEYPVDMSPEERKRLRAKLRREAKAKERKA